VCVCVHAPLCMRKHAYFFVCARVRVCWCLWAFACMLVLRHTLQPNGAMGGRAALHTLGRGHLLPAHACASVPAEACPPTSSCTPGGAL